MTTISTYIDSIEDIEISLKNGATHLMLQDPSISIQSRQVSDETTPLSFLKDALTYLDKIEYKGPLSIVADMMIHAHHVPILEALLILMSSYKQKITLRVQDPGMIELVNRHFPSINCHLVSETGNANNEGLESYQRMGFSGFTLSNELKLSDLQDIRKRIKNCDLQVQGPILLQYSLRRFLSSLKNNTEDLIETTAYDTDLPNRLFSFLDTTHGHLMYAHFHRCLITKLSELKALNLDGWIIDTRGQCKDYKEIAIQFYANALANNDKNPYSEEIITKLKELSKKPQKLGFFFVNKTDDDWRDEKTDRIRKNTIVAKVIDTKKKEYCVLELKKTVATIKDCFLITPEQKEISLREFTCTSMTNETITELKNNTIVKLPWHKGICVGTLLLKKD